MPLAAAVPAYASREPAGPQSEQGRTFPAGASFLVELETCRCRTCCLEVLLVVVMVTLVTVYDVAGLTAPERAAAPGSTGASTRERARCTLQTSAPVWGCGLLLLGEELAADAVNCGMYRAVKALR